MSTLGVIPGLPGVRTALTATARSVFRQGDWEVDLALGKVIAGAYSRDPGNTGSLNVLRSGLLMGKRSSDNKWAPSIIGVTTGAVSATGTTVTVSAAQAVELVRRVGATGTLRLVGPPAANGTVATFTETYSAVNTTTGAITTSALDADLVAGSFVCANDGTYLPLSVIPDGFGVLVTDGLGTTDLDVPFARLPVGGVLRTDFILPVWPTDTSLRQWIADKMNLGGKFIFDHLF